VKLRFQAYGSLRICLFALTFVSVAGLSSAMEIADPEKFLCGSSHIFIATVLTATDTGCFDNNWKWDTEFSRGIACDPNHIGPQLVKVKRILGALNDDPNWATNLRLAPGDRVWVQPTVINDSSPTAPNDDSIGEWGELHVNPAVNRPLNRTELRRMFTGRDFIFAAWVFDRSEFGVDPPRLQINARMYELKRLPMLMQWIRERNGKNCPAPAHSPNPESSH